MKQKGELLRRYRGRDREENRLLDRKVGSARDRKRHREGDRVEIWVEKEGNRVRDNETERRHRGKSVNYREDIGDDTEKNTDCKTGKRAAEETGSEIGKRLKRQEETEGKRQGIDLGRERGKQRKRQRNRKETQG
jgi:hypothetical protein